MREIVLDTETTGLDPLAGHRVVELGCIELINTVATGKTFHAYFNPEMIMPTGAQDVHGLSDEFLADKPLVRRTRRGVPGLHRRCPAGDPQCAVRHRLPECRAGEGRARPKLTNAYIDTVSMARRKFPGQRASLDALCERFSIDNSSRTKHGALLDSELLAEVYLELSGGRQRDLGLAPEMAGMAAVGRRPGCQQPAGASAAAACAERGRTCRPRCVPAQLSDPLWLKA